ncbi:MAG TPA: HAD family hydrolase, partial [Thermodesulfobacteriota bacterium]|nr:HAD family hydrolase [Thermodesulfobacteriota bacterium]
MLVNARAGSSAVFLDRDGTINEEVEYLARPEQLILLPTVADAVRLLNEKGIRVIVVTNQSGIARGYFSEDQLQQIHTILQQKLAQEGAHIDRFYYCPHHPDYGEEPYRQNCECRKPHTGMFLQAARDEKLD